MKTIRYSDNKLYYWIKELAMPRDFWLSVVKYKEKPKSTGWISDIVQFDTCTNNYYYREVLYFTFWKVRDRNNIQELVNDNNELVKDYQDVQELMKRSI